MATTRAQFLFVWAWHDCDGSCDIAVAASTVLLGLSGNIVAEKVEHGHGMHDFLHRWLVYRPNEELVLPDRQRGRLPKGSASRGAIGDSWCRKVSMSSADESQACSLNTDDSLLIIFSST